MCDKHNFTFNLIYILCFKNKKHVFKTLIWVGIFSN